MKFGQYLVEQKIVDAETIVQALSIQRRRNLIPIGEIALQKHLITAQQLFDILNRQDETNERFGEAACSLNYLTQDQLLQLLTIQRSIHGTIGAILIELKKADKSVIDQAWIDYHKAKKASAKPAEPKQERTEAPIAAANDSLFTQSKAKCPVCDNEEKHSLISCKAYRKSGHDIDLKPNSYAWTDPENSLTNPALYDIWHCSACGYTASYRYYKNVAREVSVSPYNYSKKAKKACLNEAIIQLKNLYTEQKDDYCKALVLLHTAIAILEKMPPICQKDALPLANHYHHLAWLYRDINNLPTNSTSKQAANQLLQTMENLSPGTIVSEQQALEKSLNSYETALYESECVESEGLTHIIQQVMGRIHIYQENLLDAEELLKEASKTAEYRIKCINEKLENPVSIDVDDAPLTNEKSKLTAFLMDTVELFKYLTE